MSLTSEQITAQNFKEFYDRIFPYLNGSIQFSTMPTASADYLGTTVQYVGATGGGFTHNYFYECVSDGESTPTYSWSAVNVQAGGGASIDTSIIAPEFDATESYSEGDRVTKDGKLYVFTDDHTGAWDVADVEETDVDSEIPALLTSAQMQAIKDAFVVNKPVQYATNPVGCIIQMMGVSAPTGYLACDGTVYDIEDYPTLAGYFATQFGASNNFGGNGTTTFAVPDLRGEFLRGTGTNSHTNQGNGANVGVHQDGTIFNETVKAGYKLYITNGDYKTSAQESGHWIENNFTESHDSYTSRPTNTSVLYCIKY